MRDLSSRPVLIVEDLDYDYEMIERNFKRLGANCRLIRREGVDETLRYLDEAASEPTKSAVPDLIILDLKLKDGDGQEVLVHVKQSEAFCAVPVVVWTAQTDPSVREACERAGVASFIIKATDGGSFHPLLERFLSSWMQTSNPNPASSLS